MVGDAEKELKATKPSLEGEMSSTDMEELLSMSNDGFKEYKKNAAAGGVMGMIQQIINDAKAMEAEAIRAEEDAQKAHGDFVKETNASIETKTKEIINKSEEKAKAETDLTQANEDKEAVLLELEQLSNYNAELHQSCDFVMKNFEIRQTARDEEIEAFQVQSRPMPSKLEKIQKHSHLLRGILRRP